MTGIRTRTIRTVPVSFHAFWMSAGNQQPVNQIQVSCLVLHPYA